ncbi:MAG: Flp pilus assembly complex ATPase component TadA [Phycisphaerae bacterium]|nr:Flp pilus assembly complex ATPase component TadA [Phycisphaerae bacterium]
MTGKRVKKGKSAAAVKKKAARKPVADTGRAGEQADDLLNMDQAIAMLKTSRPTFYRWLRAGKIKSMKVGRQWRFYRADIERFLKGQEPKIELPTDIGPLVKSLDDRLRKLGGISPSAPDTEPVSRAAVLIIVLGATMRASDIHIEPYVKSAVIRCRVDGVLHPVVEFDIRLLPAIVERFKQLSACDVHEKALPQDGRIMITFKEKKGQVELDIRICFLPALVGEAVTLRILRPDQINLSIDSIGHAPADREKLLRAIEAPHGLVIISGPIGCGKTTVLYACLVHLISPGIKVMSVEDPVEYLIGGMVQVPVRQKEGLTFARATRSFMRSDPDVIMIGEIRDFETLMIAHQAALTGHLIMTTLHTDDAVGALKRMLDMGAEPFMIADATKLISAQRLVRCVCKACSTPDEPSAKVLMRAEEMAGAGGLQWEALEKNFRKPVGCSECGQMGYRGRTLIAEMLEVTPEIGQALRGGASADEMRAIAVRGGMTTMAADGIRRAAGGEITLDEVFRVMSLR